MKILCACEESQAICSRMRMIGHEAYSCDIQECSGGHPEWHLKTDVVPLLREQWDMVIAFPPCTHLCVSGARHFEQKRKDGRQQSGIDFFMLFADLTHIPHVAIENPIGIMSNIYREPDQIIHPWMFGDRASKATCLWIKGLPLLRPTKIVDRGEFVHYESGKRMARWYSDAFSLSPSDRSRVRSKTFDGIADAIADQWGNRDLSAYVGGRDIGGAVKYDLFS